MDALVRLHELRGRVGIATWLCVARLLDRLSMLSRADASRCFASAAARQWLYAHYAPGASDGGSLIDNYTINLGCAYTPCARAPA